MEFMKFNIKSLFYMEIILFSPRAEKALLNQAGFRHFSLILIETLYIYWNFMDFIKFVNAMNVEKVREYLGFTLNSYLLIFFRKILIRV